VHAVSCSQVGERTS